MKLEVIIQYVCRTEYHPGEIKFEYGTVPMIPLEVSTRARRYILISIPQWDIRPRARFRSNIDLVCFLDSIFRHNDKRDTFFRKLEKAFNDAYYNEGEIFTTLHHFAIWDFRNPFTGLVYFLDTIRSKLCATN